MADEQAVFSGEFASAKAYFDALTAEGERSVTAHDRTIYAMCRSERLLDLVRRFTVFDGGVRRSARRLQYLRLRAALAARTRMDNLRVETEEGRARNN